MLIRLTEPVSRNSSSNWLLSAEGLDDPRDWSRFLPAAVNSQRALFESTVRSFGSGPALKLRKDLLRAGLSAFEYDWSSDEVGILEHALAIAERLEVELVIGAELSHHAA